MKSRILLASILFVSLLLSGCAKDKPEIIASPEGWSSYSTVGKAQLSLPANTYNPEELKKDTSDTKIEFQYFKPLDEKAPKIIALSMTPQLWLKGLLVFFDVTDDCFQSGFTSSYKKSLTSAIIAKDHPDAKITWKRDSATKINDRETLRLEGTMTSSKLPKPLTHEHYIWKENGDIFVAVFLYDPAQVPSPKGKIQLIMKSIAHP